MARALVDVRLGSLCLRGCENSLWPVRVSEPTVGGGNRPIMERPVTRRMFLLESVYIL